MSAELRDAIVQMSQRRGLNPVDVATAMSYETAGTFDPWKKGPVTQYGRHRGLIQWGGPQRRRYGVYRGMPVAEQVEAAGKYLDDAGVKPGMGLLDVYSAINAGKVGRYNASDANNGGAPGNVRDKVESQMAGHRQKALALLGEDYTAQPASVQAVNAMANGEAMPPSPQGATQEMAQAAPVDFDPSQFGGVLVDAPPQLEVTPQQGFTPFDGEVDFDPTQFGALPVDGQDPNLAALSTLTQNPTTANAPEIQSQERPGSPEQSQAFIDSIIPGIPIVGPALQGLGDRISAGVASTASPLFGKDISYDQALSTLQDNRAGRQERNPTASTAGAVTGGVTSTLGLGATAWGAKALGLTGASALGRMGASMGSMGAISGADTLARGGSISDAGKSAVIGTALGAIPGVVGAARTTLGAVLSPLVSAAKSLTNPAGATGARVSRALGADMAGGQRVLSQADEASAALNGQKVLNVDRGGEMTRRLGVAAINTNSEAGGILKTAVGDRFQEQSPRAVSFLDRIMGGLIDDLAAQANLKAQAKVQNSAAYAKAENSPAAQELWTTELQDLAQAPAVKDAMLSAHKTGGNIAVIEGAKPIKNPFKEVNGTLELVKNADGSVARPNLRYWNSVKINLDGEIGKAYRAGNDALGGQLTALKSKLTSTLDAAVPEYKTARAGASAFFGAEDALNAGKNAVTLKKQLPEMLAAHAKMTPAEKELFGIGFASSLKDSIKEVGNGRNIVINQIFDSPAAMERIKMAIGPMRARELQSFLRVESAMDMMRQAMNRSTTAQQMRDLGIIGAGSGIATGAATGDWTKGASAAALVPTLIFGAKQAGARADEAVMKRVAEMLTSDDPQIMKRAIQQATKSKPFMNALKAIEASAAKLLPAAAIGTATSQGEP